jgi:hypothetical protein
MENGLPLEWFTRATRSDLLHSTRGGEVQSDWVIPLRDLNRIRPLFSLAFPSLFPDGKGGFVAYRKTEVISIDWLRHLLMQGS